MKSTMKSGFTLIELLVVVAIIAVIGAGVAVTFNRLDERAKTAAEINDIGVLTDTIKHWSFLHGWALPDGMDSLIDTDGNLYSQMPASGGMTGIGPINSYNRGLYAQSGYTFSAATPAANTVFTALAAGGISHVYPHDASRTPANDSTFAASGMGADVDTSDTAATLATTDNEDARRDEGSVRCVWRWRRADRSRPARRESRPAVRSVRDEAFGGGRRQLGGACAPRIDGGCKGAENECPDARG